MLQSSPSSTPPALTCMRAGPDPSPPRWIPSGVAQPPSSPSPNWWLYRQPVWALTIPKTIPNWRTTLQLIFPVWDDAHLGLSAWQPLYPQSSWSGDSTLLLRSNATHQARAKDDVILWRLQKKIKIEIRIWNRDWKSPTKPILFPVCPFTETLPTVDLKPSQPATAFGKEHALGSLLEMQGLWHIPEILNQNMSFDKNPWWSVSTQRFGKPLLS